MDETLKKINDLLKKFNSTFDIAPNIVKQGDEQFVNGLKITNTKNDGAEFVNEIFDMFNIIVQSVSGDYELVYDKKRGLAIAKKVVTVNYVFEDEPTTVQVEQVAETKEEVEEIAQTDEDGEVAEKQ